MISVDCNRKNDGTPILSAKDIDIDAERLIMDYDKFLLQEPCEIPVETFVECYQGLTIDYQFLSHCGVYLGMMIFNDTDRIAVYNPDRKEAEYIHADAGTVILDNSLFGPGQEHRYRFTLAHEGPGHGIYHYPYFKRDDNQMSLLDFGLSTEQHPEIRCRIVENNSAHKKKKMCTRDDWMEWQANYMAAAFLMPKSTVAMKINEYCTEKETKCGMSNKDRIYELVGILSDVYNVSTETSFYRLKGLNYIADKDMQYSYGEYLFSGM